MRSPRWAPALAIAALLATGCAKYTDPNALPGPGGSGGTSGGTGGGAGGGGGTGGGSGGSGGGGSGGGGTGGGGSGGTASAVLAPIPVPGATFYVDTWSGDDGNEGHTLATAFRTLTRGLNALSKGGGDRLFLHGTFQETLNLANINQTGGGNSALPTVVQCAFDLSGNPLPASIDGGLHRAAQFPFNQQGLPAGFGLGTGNYLDRGIIIADCNYMTVSGLQVRGIAGLGVQSWRSSHVRMEFLDVSWTSESAIIISNGDLSGPYSTDIVVDHCRVNQSNLGRWANLATKTGYNMTSETVSLVKIDGFEITDNQITNTLMDGIDFKFGSRNGIVAGNLVRNSRASAIYANEGLDSKIYHNLIEQVGWYDPEDGSGLQLAAPYLLAKVPGVISGSGEDGAQGILIGNGDLGGSPFETGRVSGIEVFENVVCWTRKMAFSVNNDWRRRGLSGWAVDDLKIYNNVAFGNSQSGVSTPAAILIDVSATNTFVANNAVVNGARYGIAVLDPTAMTFSPTNEITNNLLWQNQPGGISGLLPVNLDPLFQAVPSAPGQAANFQLDTASPAVGAGTPVTLPGTSNAMDIGAFQYAATPWTAGGI